MSTVGVTRLDARRRPGRPSAAPAEDEEDGPSEVAAAPRNEALQQEPRAPLAAAPDVRDPEEWDREYRLALAELDFLHRAFSNTRASSRAVAPREEPESFPVEDPPAPRETVAPEVVPEPHGIASPYLEERLETAQAAAAALSGEVTEMESRGAVLRVAVQTIEDELVRASDELAYLRERSEREYDRAPPGPSVTPPADRRRAGPPRPPPYEQFTAERYNQTVRSAVDRRRRVAAYTVVLAAVISTVLLALTVFAREPIPTPWVLGVLPAVWLVPVPFFVVSFRGSQRVLGNHPLDVAEVS